MGVHTPVGLPYLIREGILPQEPKQELYQWEIYVFDEGYGDVEEEVLATKTCVVWCQGKFVRTVYRFGLEGEVVGQALLTSFPADNLDRTEGRDVSTKQSNGTTKAASLKSQKSSAKDSKQQEARTSERALVVLLKTKAHIYFLYGTHHIVDLPFEIERAFPAPKGLVLQRKLAPLPSLLPTPKIPAAPPNSFFSSQLHPNSSYLQSPTLEKSFASSQPPRPSPLGSRTTSGKLDALFDDVLGSPSKAAQDEVATLYSLTSPLSELGVLTFSLQHHKPRISSKMPGGLSVEFESLDPAEEVIYVSAQNELRSGGSSGPGQLTLVVTASNDDQTVTVWHAWYVEERSLTSLLKQRAANKAAKARRRSSFLSANIGTGTTTPAVRHREGPRESFAGEAATTRSTAPSRQPTRQEEEEAFASQMDPDFQPAGSQQAPKESRRISSLVSRGELSAVDPRASQNSVGASFAGHVGRRNQSFGGLNDRRSFAHRKSRGSTPGSTFSQSLGVEDTMDLDDSDADEERSINHVVQHIRATYEAAGADSLFGSVDDGFKRELVLRKLDTVSLRSSCGEMKGAAKSCKVVTLCDVRASTSAENARLNVYIHNPATLEVHCVQCLVASRPLWPGTPNGPIVAVPYSIRQDKLGGCADILKLSEGPEQAMLLGGLGIIFSSDNDEVAPLPPSASYRVYDPLDVISALHQADKEVGRNRTLQVFEFDSKLLRHAGAHGTFDEVAKDGIYHRRRLQLSPSSSFITNALEVCRTVLPLDQAQIVTGLWCVAHARLSHDPNLPAYTASCIEWIALTTTVFYFATGLVDAKARAALRVSRLSAGKRRAQDYNATRLHHQQHRTPLRSKPAWNWTIDQQLSLTPPHGSPGQDGKKDQLLVLAATLADELRSAPAIKPDISGASRHLVVQWSLKLMLGLHVFREEQKLSTLTGPQSRTFDLAPVIAQLGSWLGLDEWSSLDGHYYTLEGASADRWAYVKSSNAPRPTLGFMDTPVGVFEWFENALKDGSVDSFPSLATIAELYSEQSVQQILVEEAATLTPRTSALSQMITDTNGLNASPIMTVELMLKHNLHNGTLETLPKAVAAPLKEAISRCEREPPTTWSPQLLRLVGREDLMNGPEAKRDRTGAVATQPASSSQTRDVQTACHLVDHPAQTIKTREAGRHAVSQLIFSEDRRLVEATSLMHFNSMQVAECAKQPDWSDAQHFEQQRRIMQWVVLRMIALPAGDGMIHFDSQMPLMTEKYQLPGFHSAAIMQPMGHTVTTDRSGLTEEKVNWAYFHAGVAAGLRISKSAKGIDTSWLVFNKPNDLTNRHAGLLLALGLGGHLRHLAKWLSFKYLTPKHTMTSVGLLLGISASYMGTQDSLITRMLSVHITRMLPPGAAELNVSPTTQTAGLMGIGLLYYNTQHRRMTEIMLSEIEHMEIEDPDNGHDLLRDESYRLAAGYALGLINLGKGRNLRGLHGMHLPERLLAVAVGPRPVSAVHIFDKATAGAIVAITLVYMKSGDKTIARKIDIPDTEAQFDQVRPDMLMLRTMAKQIIMWDDLKIEESSKGGPFWIDDRVPACYRQKLRRINTENIRREPLKSADVPFFNICTGLAWALSLKYAGTGNEHARTEILTLLDYFHGAKSRADAYYYDAKLARASIRRCVDVLALSAATVMAGTGDLTTFRYLRRLHGRTDAETPYGSHLAAHLGIGLLFLGGGTYTLSTSDLALASMMCAFYPLFPTDVHDNRVHLQAFRHLWVFAAEARCLLVEDIDTHRPISMPIVTNFKDGTVKSMKAPCLLPELDTVATIQTTDPSYWRVTLDFIRNPDHLTPFKKSQTISVRRCPAAEAHSSVFSATLAALNDSQSLTPDKAQLWDWVFNLPAFKELDKADIELILPPDLHSSVHTDDRGTVVDDRLVLSRAVKSGDRNELWNLRILFAWAERARDTGDGRLRWIGHEVVDALKARIEERIRSV